MFRKFHCILLITCLSAPCMVAFGWLQYQRTQVRKEVKRQIIAGMDENALILLKFSRETAQTALKWEHKSEFEYQGQLYDLVRSVQKFDTIYYYCWLDRQESEINQQINALVAQILETTPNPNQQQQHLIQFYKSLYHSEYTAWFILWMEPNWEKVQKSAPLFPKSESIAPLSPPPKS